MWPGLRKTNLFYCIAEQRFPDRNALEFSTGKLKITGSAAGKIYIETYNLAGNKKLMLPVITAIY